MHALMTIGEVAEQAGLRASAIRFYERNGYVASGRVGDFFGMPLYEYLKPL